MVDTLEENAVQQLKDFDGHKLKSASNEDSYLGDENEQKPCVNLGIHEDSTVWSRNRPL